MDLGSVTPPGAALEATGITKRYGRDTALDGIDLHVGQGEVHGLLGPNGAGKSTTLATVLGLVLPDEGVLRLFGRTQAEAGATWLDGVAGFVEAPTFYPYLTARQNLRVLGRLDRDRSSPGVEQVLEMVGLGGHGARKVKGFSLGMRQRLGLAASLLRRPRLLVVDEPGNGMDPAGMRDLRSALRQVAELGCSVLLSSHGIAQVEQICDRVTVLQRGRVVFGGTVAELRAGSPDPDWQVRTGDDRLAAEIGASLVGVVTSLGEEGLCVTADEATLDAFIARLVAAGVPVRALALSQSSLESRFFQLTAEPDGAS